MQLNFIKYTVEELFKGDKMKQSAVIFDRDGTLASCFKRPVNRTGAEWEEFNACLPFDSPVPMVCGLLKSVRPSVARIMVSGRSEGDWPGDRRRRFAMQDWIAKHHLPIDYLFMRSGGDRRKDSVVKHEILHVMILPHFDIKFAIDDRLEVAQVWRDHGIYVIDVTDPDIPPLIGALYECST